MIAEPSITATLVATAVLVVGGRMRTWTLPSRRAPRTRTTVGRGWRPWRAVGWASWLRRTGPTDTEVAEWCEQVAAALRAGSSLTRSIVETDAGRADGPLFPTIDHAVHRGRSLRTGLDELSADPAAPLGLVVPVLAACADVGGPAAPSLERLAATLQARAAEHAERRANSAQARLSARVLTTVPFGILALLAVAEPSVRTTLTSPAGQACVLLGGGLNLAGSWWMRRIIGSAR